jgi:hypothetical protein
MSSFMFILLGKWMMLQAGEEDHPYLLWQIFQSLVYTELGDNFSTKEDFSQQISHLKFQDELH